MTHQVTIKTTRATMKRTMVLLAVMMAAIVVLSGPVASVLDLPEPTAEAKKKKKKKKKRPLIVVPAPAPELNTVQCTTNPCQGTLGNDNMIGTSGINNISALAGNDLISAGEGNDTTDGGSGDDTYAYADGWGQDTLTDVSGTDHLNFSAVGNAGASNDPISGGVFAELTPELGQNYADLNGSSLTNGIDLSSETVVEKVTGSSKYDVIYTGGANNMLQPGPGAGGANFTDYGGCPAPRCTVAVPASSDTYSGFAASGYGPVSIHDHGGTADKLVLPFASTDVYFEAVDNDGFNGDDTLIMMTSSSDSFYITAQLEPLGSQKGHIEQIQFTDGTFKIGSETPSQTLSSAKTADSPESQVAKLNEASNLDASEKDKRSKAAKKIIAEAKKQAQDLDGKLAPSGGGGGEEKR